MVVRVLSVASEAVPLVKTGGLADVAGALPASVAGHDVAMTTLLPGYPGVMARVKATPGARRVHRWKNLLGHAGDLWLATLDGTGEGAPLLALDCPALFERAGGPYGDANGADWPDNGLRFAAFARAAADVAGGAVPGLGFDVLHAHDWQAGLAPAYLRFAPLGDGKPVRTVMTIHNMAFQGHFSGALFGRLGLPAHAFAIDGVEYHGGVGFLKAGLEAADMITTVSPTYAREIRSAQFGMGLEGLIVARGERVRGLLNGIDTAEWNPSTDSALAAPFGLRSLPRRAANKLALETEFGLDHDDGPLFIVVSRLTWQKGMDILPGVLDHLVGLGGRLALLGNGDAAIVNALHGAAARHPGRIGVHIGYDEALSHRMQAGGDAILVPSRFEPCGLTQLYGLAYGCVPVVARTGGLADTVIDANLAAVNAQVATGLQFAEVSPAGIAGAIGRAVGLYRQGDVWRSLQKAGMKADFSWARCGEAYANLYRELVTETP